MVEDAVITKFTLIKISFECVAILKVQFKNKNKKTQETEVLNISNSICKSCDLVIRCGSTAWLISMQVETKGNGVCR